MIHHARPIHPLGSNRDAGCSNADPSIVTAVFDIPDRLAEPVGGLGGAVLATPKED
jgi:hypothetical protein